MFDRTIAAIQTRDKDDWIVADAVLADVPAQAPLGRFDDLVNELDRQGIDFSAQTLRNYRDAALQWPTDTRIKGVSFTAHRMAIPAGERRADVIRAILQRAGKCTVAAVKEEIAALNPAGVTAVAATFKLVGQLTTLLHTLTGDADYEQAIETMAKSSPTEYDVIDQASREASSVWRAMNGALEAADKDRAGEPAAPEAEVAAVTDVKVAPLLGAGRGE